MAHTCLFNSHSLKTDQLFLSIKGDNGIHCSVMDGPWSQDLVKSHYLIPINIVFQEQGSPSLAELSLWGSAGGWSWLRGVSFHPRAGALQRFNAVLVTFFRELSCHLKHSNCQRVLTTKLFQKNWSVNVWHEELLASGSQKLALSLKSVFDF